MGSHCCCCFNRTKRCAIKDKENSTHNIIDHLVQFSRSVEACKKFTHPCHGNSRLTRCSSTVPLFFLLSPSNSHLPFCKWTESRGTSAVVNSVFTEAMGCQVSILSGDPPTHTHMISLNDSLLSFSHYLALKGEGPVHPPTRSPLRYLSFLPFPSVLYDLGARKTVRNFKWSLKPDAHMWSQLL